MTIDQLIDALEDCKKNPNNKLCGDAIVYLAIPNMPHAPINGVGMPQVAITEDADKLESLVSLFVAEHLIAPTANVVIDAEYVENVTSDQPINFLVLDGEVGEWQSPKYDHKRIKALLKNPAFEYSERFQLIVDIKKGTKFEVDKIVKIEIFDPNSPIPWCNVFSEYVMDGDVTEKVLYTFFTSEDVVNARIRLSSANLPNVLNIV